MKVLSGVSPFDTLAKSVGLGCEDHMGAHDESCIDCIRAQRHILLLRVTTHEQRERDLRSHIGKLDSAARELYIKKLLEPRGPVSE